MTMVPCVPLRVKPARNANQSSVNIDINDAGFEIKSCKCPLTARELPVIVATVAVPYDGPFKKSEGRSVENVDTNAWPRRGSA